VLNPANGPVVPARHDNCVDAVLNGAQVNVLSDILNNSQVLSNIAVDVQNVLNDNEVLKNFLNSNNVALNRVIAVDVLSAPVTLYVFEPR
jgi:hypothetical protein